MYIHLGQEKVVRSADLIGIFDLDNTTVSRHTRDFLNRAERAGQVSNVAQDIPKSFVVCGSTGGECSVYLTQISCAALKRRMSRGEG